MGKGEGGRLIMAMGRRKYLIETDHVGAGTPGYLQRIRTDVEDIPHHRFCKLFIPKTNMNLD